MSTIPNQQGSSLLNDETMPTAAIDNPFKDVVDEKLRENTGPRIVDGEANVFDETFTLDQWMTVPLSLHVEETVKPKGDCWDECREKVRLANEKCAAFRKRVQKALNEAGCPSKVTALKRSGGCGAKSKKK